jgi:uncharacterized protein
MRENVRRVLATLDRPAVAVSGGVDSVTLAAMTAEVCPGAVLMHAVSPAVPREATDRVLRLAAARGWQLDIIDAGEFADPRYRENPVNRCFFCKTHLYASIASRTDRQILSGANLDDLGEYRPGLDAARRHGVRHPYIEAGVDKRGVRALARLMDLSDVAELPSSPCLSSRVETGVRIAADLLGFIHAVERRIQADFAPSTVRCRVRARAVVIELDDLAFAGLSDAGRTALHALVLSTPHRPAHLPVEVQRYRNGSAFLTGDSA